MPEFYFFTPTAPQSAPTKDPTIRMKPQPASSTQEVLAGLVERVTFHNAENGFCVLRAKARGHRELVTVVPGDFGYSGSLSDDPWRHPFSADRGPAPDLNMTGRVLPHCFVHDFQRALGVVCCADHGNAELRHQFDLEFAHHFQGPVKRREHARRASYSPVLRGAGVRPEGNCPTGLAVTTGAVPRTLGRGRGNGVLGEKRTSAHVNIDPAIRPIKAKMPARRTPTSRGCLSICGGDMWEDVI